MATDQTQQELSAISTTGAWVPLFVLVNGKGGVVRRDLMEQKNLNFNATWLWIKDKKQTKSRQAGQYKKGD